MLLIGRIFGLLTLSALGFTVAYICNLKVLVVDKDKVLEDLISKRAEASHLCFYDAKWSITKHKLIASQRNDFFCGAYNAIDISIHSIKAQQLIKK